MKRTLSSLACVALALAVLAGGAFAQKKPDIVGTCLGYAITGDGSRGLEPSREDGDGEQAAPQ